jgi:hypothetical protein
MDNEPAIGGLDNEDTMAERPASFGPISHAEMPAFPLGLQRDHNRRNKVCPCSVLSCRHTDTTCEQLAAFHPIAEDIEGSYGIVVTQMVVSSSSPCLCFIVTQNKHHTLGPPSGRRCQQWAKCRQFEEGNQKTCTGPGEAEDQSNNTRPI